LSGSDGCGNVDWSIHGVLNWGIVDRLPLHHSLSPGKTDVGLLAPLLSDPCSLLGRFHGCAHPSECLCAGDGRVDRSIHGVLDGRIVDRLPLHSSLCPGKADVRLPALLLGDPGLLLVKQFLENWDSSFSDTEQGFVSL
jgi:hypothetical protein